MSAVIGTEADSRVVAELPDLTGRLLTAASVEETLARTLDGVGGYAPASALAAAWDVNGSTGAVVLAGRAVPADEARALVDEAIATRGEPGDPRIGPPRFVRTVLVRPRGEMGARPDWTQARRIALAPSSGVGFLFCGSGADPAEAFDHPDVTVLLHCAAACVSRLCVEAAGERGAPSGRLQRAEDLRPALRRLLSDSAEAGTDLALMLVEPLGPEDVVDEGAVTAVGRLLLGTMRHSDLVFPAGPGRFCVVMPRTNPRHALIAASRVNARLEDARPPDVPRGVRIAIGVSGLDESATSAEHLYRQAEAALAEARSPNGPGVFLYL
jgi:hypothetical protein